MKYSVCAGLLLGLALHTASSLAAKSGVLTPCELPGVKRPAKCGVVEVPENPDKPHGRRLELAVAVIPHQASESHDDPIVPLMGGPGEDAISSAEYFVGIYGSLLNDRDLLLVDQRGTGKSNALRCTLYDPQNPDRGLRDVFPPAAIEKCVKQLGRHADLTQYTYKHWARDLEHVRTALGYSQLNLQGGSYGTRAAQIFMREYPRSTRTVMLHSVVPFDVATPLTMAKSAEGVRQKAFEACAAESACAAACPDLRKEFGDVARKLESSPAGLDRGRVAEWFRSQTYRPYSSTELPWMIHRAHEGDWEPIKRGILAQSAGIDSALSFGFLLAITCNDDVPFMSEADIAAETRDTFLRDYRVRQQQAACAHWPRNPTPTDRTPVKSSIPTMFLSGDSDGASPMWFVERVAPNFPQRAEIVVGNQGHTEWSDCAGRLYEKFVRSGSADDLRGAKCDAIPRPPFKTQ
jgi:pimeloyl-ACP methyl ester carboxylesterase